MADGDLPTFDVRSDASIEPDDQRQGVNASRFAIAGALTAPGPVGAEDDSGVVQQHHLLDFGFPAGLATAARWANEGLEFEAHHLFEHTAEWAQGEARGRAWAELAEGDIGARLALLAAGMCSPLERESAAAAAAMIGVLRDEGGRGMTRMPWDLRLFSPWRELVLNWDWTNVDEASSESEPGAQRTPMAAVTWDGEAWAERSGAIVLDVLEDRSVRGLFDALMVLAHVRIERGVRSPDSTTRELALSVRLQRSEDDLEPGERLGRSSSVAAGEQLATMVHGTWGWKGDWWYPGGGFHSFIKRHHRPRLYDAGMEFSWSGAYSQRQRAIAGERFSRWVHSADGLRTAFAHSYGGEVAARAVNRGALVLELVLMSAPVNGHHLAALDRVGRTVDVRLDFDLVLMFARERQRLPARKDVKEFIVPGYFWQHGATHDPQLWHDQGIASQVNL